MKLQQLNSDQAVLDELGQRLKRRRIWLRIKQGELADRALVARSTLSKVENGHPVQTPEFLRVLRELGYFDALEQAIPDESESPLVLARTRLGRKTGKQGASRVRDPARPAKKPGQIIWPEDRGE